jgi:hypothetical protein
MLIGTLKSGKLITAADSRQTNPVTYHIGSTRVSPAVPRILLQVRSRATTAPPTAGRRLGDGGQQVPLLRVGGRAMVSSLGHAAGGATSSNLIKDFYYSIRVR